MIHRADGTVNVKPETVEVNGLVKIVVHEYGFVSLKPLLHSIVIGVPDSRSVRLGRHSKPTVRVVDSVLFTPRCHHQTSME